MILEGQHQLKKFTFRGFNGMPAEKDMIRFVQIAEQFVTTVLPASCSSIGAVWLAVESQNGETPSWGIVLLGGGAIWLCVSRLLNVLHEQKHSKRL